MIIDRTDVFKLVGLLAITLRVCDLQIFIQILKIPWKIKETITNLFNNKINKLKKFRKFKSDPTQILNFKNQIFIFYPDFGRKGKKGIKSERNFSSHTVFNVV